MPAISLALAFVLAYISSTSATRRGKVDSMLLSGALRTAVARPATSPVSSNDFKEPKRLVCSPHRLRFLHTNASHASTGRRVFGRFIRDFTNSFAAEIDL